jgi:hypothetical protein
MNSRRTRLRSVLTAILTVLVLVPAGVLFVRVWQDNSDRRASTKLEREGVEYLTPLAPLLNSLVEYQSSAVQGVNAVPDSLKPAIASVTAVDQRLGADLKTTARWTSLQDKIGKLSKAGGGSLLVFQAHAEVIDLLVALSDTVRRNSGLNRDPDNDLSNLQDAVAVDLPVAVQRVNEMGDYASIVNISPAASRGPVLVLFGESVIAGQDSIDDLTSDFQISIEQTDSRSLAGSLVSTLDGLRRAIENMNRGANFGGEPNIATIATAQSQLGSALRTLSDTVLREMDQLLDSRLNTLNHRRTEALVSALLIVLLVMAALIWPLVGRRRGETPAASPAQPAGETTRDLVSTTRTGGFPAGQYDQLPAYGQVDPTQRERSGALR